MIGKVSAKYAFRSLLRHPRRAILSMIGVGIGCAMALLAASWMGGEAEMCIRAVAESGGGHVRVVPEKWPELREDKLRLVRWKEVLAEVKTLDGVKAAVVRARTNGLLAFGTRNAGVAVTGVDPEVEVVSSRLVSKGKIDGRYLRPDDRDSVVIGKILARRLDVELDDDLYVTLAGRDEIQSAMLRIVGIIETGSHDVDAMVCHVTLNDLERLTGYPGPGEISVLIEDYRRVEATRRELAKRVGPGNAVITWKEVNPGMAGNVEGDRAFTRVLVGMIVIVVSLGIASAQLSAVLERRTEFAILSALGMKSRQVIGLVVIEALVIGLGGAVIALALGGSLAHYLATEGVNLEAFMGEDFSFGEIILDPRMYGSFGIWLVWYALAVSVVATVTASIYPAWLATRVDPADALRAA